METLHVVIANQNGLHARPAKCLVQAAAGFESDITVNKNGDDERINAKSILGVMSIGAPCGTELVFNISGPDEYEAALALRELFDNNALND